MQLNRIEFEPFAIVMLGKKELALLIKGSEHHYDGECKAAAKQGGFLWGMRNKMRVTNPPAQQLVEHRVSWRECDLMRKMLECSWPTSKQGEVRIPEHELSLRLAGQLLETMHQLSAFDALEIARPQKLA